MLFGKAHSKKAIAARLGIVVLICLFSPVPVWAQTNNNIPGQIEQGETPLDLAALISANFDQANEETNVIRRYEFYAAAISAYKNLESYRQGRGQLNSEEAETQLQLLASNGITKVTLLELTANAASNALYERVRQNPQSDYRKDYILTLSHLLELPDNHPDLFSNYIRLAETYNLNGNSERTSRMLRAAFKASGASLTEQPFQQLESAARLSASLGQVGISDLMVLAEASNREQARNLISSWAYADHLIPFNQDYEILRAAIKSDEDPILALGPFSSERDYRAFLLAGVSVEDIKEGDQFLLKLAQTLSAKRSYHQAMRVSHVIADFNINYQGRLNIIRKIADQGYSLQAQELLNELYSDTINTIAAKDRNLHFTKVEGLPLSVYAKELELYALQQNMTLFGSQESFLSRSKNDRDTQIKINLAQAYAAAQQGEFEKSIELLQRRKIAKQTRVDLALSLGPAYIRYANEEILQAMLPLIDQQTDLEPLVVSATIQCHAAKRKHADTACLALAQLLSVEDKKNLLSHRSKSEGLVRLALYGSTEQQVWARRVLRRTSKPQRVDIPFIADNKLPDADQLQQILSNSAQPDEAVILRHLASLYASHGQVQNMHELLKAITDNDMRDNAYSDVLPLLVQAGKVYPALEIAREIIDDRKRTHLYREFAFSRSLANDKYGLIDATRNVAVSTDGQLPQIMSGDIQIANTKNTTLYAPEGKPTEIGREGEFVALRDTGAMLDVRKIKLPPMVTEQSEIREMVPSTKPGLLDISLMRYNGYNSDFFEAIGETRSLRDLFVERQRQTEAQVLYINDGVFDLTAMDELSDRAGLPDAVEIRGRDVIIRRPILIGTRATLLMTGLEASNIYLSTEEAAFIVNTGNLYIVDTDLTAFNESTGEKSHADYDSRYEFRPFITSWSDSKTWITNSVIYGLGYSGAKSYGITLSAGPTIVTKNSAEKEDPIGAIVDNTLIDMYYGYYTYEAAHVDLIGNEYRNNIIYGVDPHDRSHDLRIIYNTAYGTEKKHGIIVSREVEDSYIVGNLSFNNKGSGFMIDRDSTGNLVYANEAYHNKQDGLTIFESACTLISSNNFIENNRSGVKIRNAWDVVLHENLLKKNRGGAIESYTADLKKTDAARTRDFVLDPYYPIASFAAYYNHLEKNGYGISARDTEHFQVKGNEFIYQDKAFEGEAKPWQVPLRSGNYGRGAAVQSQCRPIPPDQSCRWQDIGVFKNLLSLDGQLPHENACPPSRAGIEAPTAPQGGQP